AAFGSYGWSGEAVQRLEEWLKKMGVTIVAEGVKVRYVPDSEALEACRALGQAVAQKLVETVGNE
ncbi:MAG: flavodoxin domain-containing protein, partial [Phycisphaerae bacterium]